MSATNSYRADIDGLRALAVLSVTIFHLRASWMPNGFLGVDIFFVLSGFLITTILYLACLFRCRVCRSGVGFVALSVW